MTPNNVSGHSFIEGHDDSFRGIYSRHANHRRSRSAGRAPGRRDIVQDVYDRMGVGYARGVSSINVEPRPDSQGRGRSMHRNDGQDDGMNKQERSRSLSRGRERLAARWSSVLDKTPSTDSPGPSQSTSTVSQPQTDRTHFTGQQQCRGMSFVEAFTSSSSQPSSHPASTLQDEKKEEDPPPAKTGEEVKKAVPMRRPSIKDRINAYSGVASNASVSRTVRKSFNHQFSTSPYASKRELKPKVDIYDSGNANEGNEAAVPLYAKTEKVSTSPTRASDSLPHPDNVVNSSTNLPTNEGNPAGPSSACSSPVGRASRPGRVADAFLAAISPPSKQQPSLSPRCSKTFPILQIPSDELPASSGATSPANSANSDEILPPPASSGPRQVVCANSGKRSTPRHERLMVMAGGKLGNLTLDMIERYIDERIEEKTAELDHRFETHMRRMEERYLRHWNSWKTSKN